MLECLRLLLLTTADMLYLWESNFILPRTGRASVTPKYSRFNVSLRDGFIVLRLDKGSTDFPYRISTSAAASIKQSGLLQQALSRFDVLVLALVTAAWAF